MFKVHRTDGIGKPVSPQQWKRVSFIAKSKTTTKKNKKQNVKKYKIYFLLKAHHLFIQKKNLKGYSKLYRREIVMFSNILQLLVLDSESLTFLE